MHYAQEDLMSHIRKLANITLSIIMVLSMALSLAQPTSAYAQGGNGLKRQFNTHTNKVSFISSESGRALAAAQVLGISASARLADPAMALARRFGLEFGL